MSLSLACPNCKQRIALTGLRYGDDMTCPGCGRTYKVPNVPSLEPSPPPISPAMISTARRQRSRMAARRRRRTESPLLIFGIGALLALMFGIGLWLGFREPASRADQNEAANDANQDQVSSSDTPETDSSSDGLADSEDVSRLAAGAANAADANTVGADRENGARVERRPERVMAKPDEPIVVAGPPPDADLPIGSPIPKIRKRDLERFVGRYEVVTKTDQGHLWLFGGHSFDAKDIRGLEMELQELPGRSRLQLKYLTSFQPGHWGDSLDPSDAPNPILHEIQSEGIIAQTWRQAMQKFGFSIDDLNARNAYTTAMSCRLIKGRLIRADALLTRDESVKRGPLRDRRQLAMVMTTWDLEDDTLTIRRWAFGDELPVVRMLVAWAYTTHMLSRNLSPADCDAFIDIAIEGRTLVLRRVP